MPSGRLAFAAALLVGALAFAGIGLGTAALIRSGEGSSAIVNVILVPMAFLSGSFGPTRHYPAGPARSRRCCRCGTSSGS